MRESATPAARRRRGGEELASTASSQIPGERLLWLTKAFSRSDDRNPDAAFQYPSESHPVGTSAEAQEAGLESPYRSPGLLGSDSC